MGNVIQSQVKDPSLVITQFVKMLDGFIKDSVMNINKMKAKHQQMASVWKGDQYNKFSAVLLQSIKDATKELMELEKLRVQLVKKAKDIKEAFKN